MSINFNLSVVIISRNEETNIDRCITSVLNASKNFESEIILVDSASTDKTIELAMNYPIKIIQLRPEWPLSAAAGRYIGFLHSHGKYIHFQDGDTILDKDWFNNAIPELEMDDRIAGVVGIITQEKYNNKLSKSWDERNKNEKFGIIDSYHEDILLKREAMLDIKPFNPYLKAIEEGEFSYRLLEKGYKLIRIPYAMSLHMGGAKANFYSTLRKKMASTIAYGQILRYTYKNKKLFWKWVTNYKFIILFSILMMFGFFMVIATLFYWNVFPLFFWIFGFTSLFLYIFYERKSMKYSVNHFLSIAIRWPFLIRGFLMAPKDFDDYPLDVLILKETH